MRKQNDPNDYELRDEYDLSKLTIVPKGRFAPERRAGRNVILLAPDVVEAFLDGRSGQRGIAIGSENGEASNQKRQPSYRKVDSRLEQARLGQ